MDKGLNPVDVHVGGRVRLRRTLLGMSQSKLAEHLDLTFQQVQKNERGANRIGASRLYRLSQILGVPVSFFFDDMPNDVAATAGGRGFGDGQDKLLAFGTMSKRMTLELVRAYYRIPDARLRERVFDLVKAAADCRDNDERKTAGRPVRAGSSNDDDGEHRHEHGDGGDE